MLAVDSVVQGTAELLVAGHGPAAPSFSPASCAARHDIRVFGVTGSVGKTTCKELIAAVLGARYRVLKSPENLNTEIGLPLTLLYLTEEHERAVLEMAMYGRGEIDLLCRIGRPDVGGVTHVG